MPQPHKDLSFYLVKFGYYGLVVSVALAVLYCIFLLFVPLVASVLLTFLLDPIVKFFETKGFRRLAIIISMCIVTSLAGVATIYFVVPRLVVEAQNLAADIPQYEKMFRGSLENLRAAIENHFPGLAVPDFHAMLMQKMGSFGHLDVDMVISQLSNIFSMLSVVVIVPIVTFFFLTDGHLIHKTALRAIPNRYFEMFVLLFHRITDSLKFFIRGQLIDALAVGLKIIGVPYAFVIGIVAGIGNLIPYLGPVIGFMPAAFVVLTSPDGFTAWSFVSLIMVFGVVQFLEGTFIYPLAVGKSVDLHPLVVIIGISVGGQLGGVIGMLIAVPIISVAKVSLEVLYSNLKSYSII
ncbi:MAG: AI-2E family transporter [Chitinivibrionales bacterium]